MGSGCSKKKGSDAAEPVQLNINAPEGPESMPQVGSDDCQFAVNLSSYEAACRVDPDLPLATGVEVHLKMNLDVVKFIVESAEDIWNNKELSSLVKEYLNNGKQTLKICDALENCLKRARKNQEIIQFAVQKFEEAVLDGGEERTLHVQNKFKAAEKPFDEEFFRRFLSVRDQQVSLLKKLLQKREEVVDKNLKSVKKWRKVSNILFVTMFVSTLVFSVVAAAIASSPAVTSVASTLVFPVALLGKWCSWLLNHYRNKLEWQKGLLEMEIFTVRRTLRDMETIRALVIKMGTKIESPLVDANFALGEQETVKLAIDDIKGKLEEFVKTIDDLGKEAAKCSQVVEKATLLILQKINETFSQSAALDSPWKQFYI